jgi:hypothetical protein
MKQSTYKSEATYCHDLPLSSKTTFAGFTIEVENNRSQHPRSTHGQRKVTQ